jgi:hypothetical protein
MNGSFFTLVVHRFGERISRQDYSSFEKAIEAFAFACGNSDNDVYLNNHIGTHVKIRKALLS